MKNPFKILTLSFSLIFLSGIFGDLNAQVVKNDRDSLIVKNYVNVGVRYGIMNFYGDLDNNLNLPMSQRGSGEMFVDFSLNRSMTLGFAITKGTVAGLIRSDASDDLFVNLNFKSSILAPQVRYTYNFASLYKPPFPGIFQPRLFAGLEMIMFNPLADNLNSDGREYHYWQDGSIRDLPEAPENIPIAQLLQYDHIYETVLRDADLDGFGKYSLYTFGIPVGAGLDINLGRNLAIAVDFSYHLTFTDYIDNITAESGDLDPLRKIGNKSNDAFIYANFGITYKIWNTREVRRKERPAPPQDDIVILPMDFKPFDTNNDNIIQKEEVIEAIEEFLNGDSEHDAEMIELLVDFYNVQTTTKEKIEF